MLSSRNKEFVQIGLFHPLSAIVSILANLCAVKSIPQGDFIFRSAVEDYPRSAGNMDGAKV